MFIGVDHGTTAIRFATLKGSTFELHRGVATGMNSQEILQSIEDGLDIKLDDVKLIALTYSMGDGFSKITDLKNVKERGVRSIKAGSLIGGGTNVFDVVSSNLPAILLPGIHSGIGIDPRMKIFSHGASPEKIGIAYHAHLQNAKDLIVSDISSNTVTVGVTDKKIVGAIDACIFAPGIHHGPLDLEAIRNIDEGLMTANEAFSNSGVLKMTSHSNLKELLQAKNEEASLALRTLSLFAAMEISAMSLFLSDHDSKDEKIFLAGSLSEISEVRSEIERLLDVKTTSLGKWSAAVGCAEIARDVYGGKDEILGIEVDYN
ncbi:MAG: methanogenesis marker 12 protein [Halobacteriota archaeon]|nr:methanogenesis marker 12 protein [Halobacteriota archaeon]